MRHYTGEGKVDYTFEHIWNSGLAPWERKMFPPSGTMGIIRFYNFDIDSYQIKPGHISGYGWLGEMALNESINRTDDEILIIGAHSNTGDKAYNYQLAIMRARTVAQFLCSRRVPLSRMSVIGSKTLDRDSKGESERWRAASVVFKAYRR
jgi:outer membrane protein OmpA-like peptidoglycan-associated protein